MFPINSEFLTLYFLYFITLTILIIGLKRSKNRGFFIANLIIFLIYTVFTAYAFTDKENFKYGGSLAVLFYDIAFPITHLFALAIIYLYMSFKKS